MPTRAPHPPTAPDGADPRAIQTLYRISTLIGKTENPKVALRHILEDLVSTFHAASGSVALLNPDTGRLEVEVQHGLPLDDYTAPDHPLQQAIARDVARAVGMDVQDMPRGIDGCSAPNYAMPLSKPARGYARLASGAQDAEFGASFALLGEAMTAHPEMVSGTGRNDLDFMRVGRGDWVSKVGADGVQVVGSKSYVRVYERVGDSDHYLPIPLDVAAV